MPTDPELTRQLDEARISGDPVAAVVTLRRTRGVAPDPADIEARTSAAIAKATEASGAEPSDVRVMGHMASAYVSGSEAFIRELADQPEIASAVANVASDPGEPTLAGSRSADDELGTPVSEPDTSGDAPDAALDPVPAPSRRTSKKPARSATTTPRADTSGPAPATQAARRRRKG